MTHRTAPDRTQIVRHRPGVEVGDLVGADLDVRAGPRSGSGVGACYRATVRPVQASFTGMQCSLDIYDEATVVFGGPIHVPGVVVAELLHIHDHVTFG